MIMRKVSSSFSVSELLFLWSRKPGPDSAPAVGTLNKQSSLSGSERVPGVRLHAARPRLPPSAPLENEKRQTRGRHKSSQLGKLEDNPFFLERVVSFNKMTCFVVWLSVGWNWFPAVGGVWRGCFYAFTFYLVRTKYLLNCPFNNKQSGKEKHPDLMKDLYFQPGQWDV